MIRTEWGKSLTPVPAGGFFRTTDDVTDPPTPVSEIAFNSTTKRVTLSALETNVDLTLSNWEAVQAELDHWTELMTRIYRPATGPVPLVDRFETKRQGPLWRVYLKIEGITILNVRFDPNADNVRYFALPLREVTWPGWLLYRHVTEVCRGMVVGHLRWYHSASWGR